MPTVNCSAFTASNVGRLLRGDCRYWTSLWSVICPDRHMGGAGVAIHATFQNRHFRPPKIRGLGLGRTEEKFVDSDANSESVTTLEIASQIVMQLLRKGLTTSVVWEGSSHKWTRTWSNQTKSETRYTPVLDCYLLTFWHWMCRIQYIITIWQCKTVTQLYQWHQLLYLHFAAYVKCRRIREINKNNSCSFCFVVSVTCILFQLV